MVRGCPSWLGGGHYHSVGVGGDVFVYEILGYWSAQNIIRLADHCFGVAGGRRHHCCRNDGAQNGTRCRQVSRSHLCLRSDRHAHADWHADYSRWLSTYWYGAVHSGRIHICHICSHLRSLGGELVGVGVLRALLGYAHTESQATPACGRRR